MSQPQPSQQLLGMFIGSWVSTRVVPTAADVSVIEGVPA
jgi:hypothetical protein